MCSFRGFGEDGDIGRLHVRLSVLGGIGLWNLSHPWEPPQQVTCRGRSAQAITQHAECYVVPFCAWDDGGFVLSLCWDRHCTQHICM